MICIKNANVILPDKIEKGLLVLVENGKIADICRRCDLDRDTTVIDAHGNFLSPGFIDIHVHGGGGYSAMTEDENDIIKMCKAHNGFGTTSVLPTTLAAPVPVLLKSIAAVKKAYESNANTGIIGIHLEGPFISAGQKGAQSEKDILLPTEENVFALLDKWDKIKMMGAAPEICGGLELGKELAKRGITASVAHSDATFETVEKAISMGYSDVTHIYSGCSSVIRKNGYRFAGVVEAGLYFDALSVGVIADLRHLPVSLLKLIYKCKTADKISLITDGLEFSASTLAEGTKYVQKNGVEAVYEDGVMKLMSREAFAGSVSTSNILVRNMYKEVGISLLDSVRMATCTPAKVVKIADKKGKIQKGYDADLIIFDDDINVFFCMIKGETVKNLL